MKTRPTHNPEEPRYRLYGRLWSSAESLDHLLPRAKGTPECHYRLGAGAEPGDWDGESPLYESPIPDPQGDPRLKVWRLGGRVRAFFSGAGAYHLQDDEIVCHPLPEADRTVRDNLLLGAVLAFWMELRGLATLHASAVARGDRAVAFVSHSGGGKSSLAALLMSGGWELLTDDVLPLELEEEGVLGWPGYPMMRMWPEEAHRFAASSADLSRVHPATAKLRVPLSALSAAGFCDRPTFLSRLYFPAWSEKGDDSAPVRLEPLSPREGVIEMVRHSFAPLVVRALGLDADRLTLLSRAAVRVPMRRLVYPRGVHRSAIRQAVERDVQSGRPAD